MGKKNELPVNLRPGFSRWMSQHADDVPTGDKPEQPTMRQGNPAVHGSPASKKVSTESGRKSESTGHTSASSKSSASSKLPIDLRPRHLLGQSSKTVDPERAEKQPTMRQGNPAVHGSPVSKKASTESGRKSNTSSITRPATYGSPVHKKISTEAGRKTTAQPQNEQKPSNSIRGTLTATLAAHHGNGKATLEKREVGTTSKGGAQSTKERIAAAMKQGQAERRRVENSAYVKALRKQAADKAREAAKSKRGG